MRTTVIDGTEYHISGCGECPFLQCDGNYEDCKYPILNSMLIGRLHWHDSLNSVPADCPLPDPEKSVDDYEIQSKD